MRELLNKAKNRLESVSKGARGTEDMNSVCYEMGYMQAIRDVNKKLRIEGLEELEAGD